MAWQDEMVPMLRVLVNDVAETEFAEDSLLKVLVVSAFQVNLEMTFSQEFIASVSGETINPDPTATATKDESFVNLVCLKAACIIDRGAAALAAKQAIAVRDGASSIDLRGNLKGKLALLDKGWCAVYDDAKLEYQTGQVRVAGAMILSPFRVFASDVYGPQVNPYRDIYS